MEKEESKLDRQALMEKYSDYILSKGERPVNVYLFAKDIGISEGEFYHFFSCFDAIEKEYLQYFFDRSLKLTTQIEHYDELKAKEKLLNFYFIFFENMSMNRSLVLMLLNTDIKSKIKKYLHLKKPHRKLIQSLDIQRSDLFEKLPEKLEIFRDKPMEEILWVHFLSIFRYWKNDTSPDFEKTDIYIEKSLDTGFEFMDGGLLEKFFDLGKFICKK